MYHKWQSRSPQSRKNGGQEAVALRSTLCPATAFAAASSVAANGRMRPCRQRVDPARGGAPLRESHGAWLAARRRQTPRAPRSRRGAHLGAGRRVRREVECAPRKRCSGACAAPSVGDDRHRAVAEAGVLELRRPIEHQFTGTFARITCAPPPCGPTGADRPFLMPRIPTHVTSLVDESHTQGPRAGQGGRPRLTRALVKSLRAGVVDEVGPIPAPRRIRPPTPPPAHAPRRAPHRPHPCSAAPRRRSRFQKSAHPWSACSAPSTSAGRGGASRSMDSSGGS